MANGVNSSTVGKAIKQARASAGLTQQDLADRVGVHWLTISRYERGATNITVDRLGQIAHVLNCNTTDFLGAAA